MVKSQNRNAVDRIIDANINRSKEGLRVCEEIFRFILEDRRLAFAFKKARHSLSALIKKIPAAQELIRERMSLSDIGMNIYADELKRKNFQEIFFANIQRVKESLRVLEEFSKLKDTKISVALKKLRYEVYEIERKATEKISANNL